MAMLWWKSKDRVRLRVGWHHTARSEARLSQSYDLCHSKIRHAQSPSEVSNEVHQPASEYEPREALIGSSRLCSSSGYKILWTNTFSCIEGSISSHYKSNKHTGTPRRQRIY